MVSSYRATSIRTKDFAISKVYVALAECVRLKKQCIKCELLSSLVARDNDEKKRRSDEIIFFSSPYDKYVNKLA